MSARANDEITENTRVPLRMVFGVVAATVAVVGLWWSLKLDLAELRQRASRTWTIESQESWSLRLQNSNPGLKVPDARESWRQAGETPGAVAAAKE